MLSAGLACFVTNLLTPALTFVLGLPSTVVVTWQKIAATGASLPLIFRIGLGALRTRQPFWRKARGLSGGCGRAGLRREPPERYPRLADGSAVDAGSLHRRHGCYPLPGRDILSRRLGATAMGFLGAVMVARIGTEQPTRASALPVLAAAGRGSVSVVPKHLARDEAAESFTHYVLVTPNHLLIGPLAGLGTPDLPDGLAGGC